MSLTAPGPPAVRLIGLQCPARVGDPVRSVRD